MADYTRQEVHRLVAIEYTVPTREPWGACWNEVYNALEIAYGEYKHLYGSTPSDDAIRVHTRDDEIVIIFDKPQMTRPDEPPLRPWAPDDHD